MLGFVGGCGLVRGSAGVRRKGREVRCSMEKGPMSRREFLLASGAAMGGIALGTPEEAAAQWSAFEAPRRWGEEESIYDTKIGSFLPPRATPLLRKRRSDLDRVVIVGETHTNPLHHRAELEVIQSLHELEPDRPLVIGMEHFYRKHQRILDDYVGGRISLTKMHELTQWDRTFGYEFNMWAPIFRFCQEKNIPIVGLNLPFEVVRAVSHLGLQQLPPELLAVLPEVDLTNRRHQMRFMENMGLSAHDTKGVTNHGFDVQSVEFQRYYEAATLWDEYMAETASAWLRKNEDQDGRMVILAGSAHVAGRDGIPDRITKRTGCSCFTIINQGVQWNEHSPKIASPPRRDVADWVWFTRREVDLV